MASVNVNVHLEAGDPIAAISSDGPDPCHWLRVGWNVSVWVDTREQAERLAAASLDLAALMPIEIASAAPVQVPSIEDLPF